MLSGIWNKVRLYCGNHEEPVRMFLHGKAEGSVAAGLYGQGLESFYTCPKYYPANRKEGEPLCRNHITIKEYESAVQKISEILEKTDGESIDGFSWKSKAGVEYRVTKHTNTEIRLECRNTRALRF